jgi:hypothetical protein
MTDIAILRLHNRIDFLEDRMTDMEARVPGPINNTTPAALTRDLESLTAYVGLLETLINDIEKDLNKRLDVHRTDIDTLENDGRHLRQRDRPHRQARTGCGFRN